MDFHGTAVRRTAYDIDEAARLLRVSTVHILTVLDVEAHGKGFLRDRRPVILFEPHVFYRELPGHKRAGAMRQGVACKKWGEIKYPKSVSGSYDRLAVAMQIDPEAALESCSWGLGQVMGFNHAVAGYDDVFTFVEAMKRSEGDQLMAMMSFIRTNRLDDELRRGDWAGFARGYNGKGYRKNRYHIKLANAFAKHRHAGTERPIRVAHNSNWLGRGAAGGEVRDLQTALNLLDANLVVDGDFGNGTRDALMHLQRKLGLRPDGLYGKQTKAAIASALEETLAA